MSWYLERILAKDVCDINNKLENQDLTPEEREELLKELAEAEKAYQDYNN